MIVQPGEPVTAGGAEPRRCAMSDSSQRCCSGARPAWQSLARAQRAAAAASTAARSAARAYVTSPDEASGPARARAAARLAFTDQGIDAAAPGLTLTCRPDPANCLAPGSRVTATVRSSVRLPLVPDALGGNAPRIRVDAVSTSPYGTFREDRP